MESLFKAVSNTVIVTTRFTIELAVGALCGGGIVSGTAPYAANRHTHTNIQKTLLTLC